jgi:hypothetical protein
MRNPLSGLPASRVEARKLGLDRFFTGAPCLHGHVVPRYVSTTNCIQCQVEHARRNGGWNARPPKEEYLRTARELAEKKGGVLLSTEYILAKSKLSVRCGQGHEFESTADNLKKRWCPVCKRASHSKRMAAKLRPVDELREFARREHGGDCLATFPVPLHTRVLWKCSHPEHEQFVATISHVLHAKTWCPACDAERRRLHPPKPQIPRTAVEQLVKRRGGNVVQVLGDGPWKGLRTRLRIRCADAHEWNVTADNLMHAGSWCPECRNKGERIVRAIFEATFGEKFPKLKPAWLTIITGRRLELDGLSENLKLAFEYQGPHHFTQASVRATDDLKRHACLAHGVRLVEIEAVKKPFPASNVLKKVAEAFRREVFPQVPVLPPVEIFARELEELRRLAQQRGGTLISTTYCGSERHEWHCGNSDHLSWWAEPWRVRKGAWCPSCAGNRPLGIEGLRTWGQSCGLELLDTKFYGSNVAYNWRCKESGHVFRRNKSNIQQSLVRNLFACGVCSSQITRSTNVRTKRSDDFAQSILPVIMVLRQQGFTSLGALADQLNKRHLVTVRGTRWYPSTVKNLLTRSKRFQKLSP